MEKHLAKSRGILTALAVGFVAFFASDNLAAQDRGVLYPGMSDAESYIWHLKQRVILFDSCAQTIESKMLNSAYYRIKMKLSGEQETKSEIKKAATYRCTAVMRDIFDSHRKGERCTLFNIANTLVKSNGLVPMFYLRLNEKGNFEFVIHRYYRRMYPQIGPSQEIKGYPDRG